MTREDLLAIFVDAAPTARSPYGLYGHPPMWRVAERAGVTLFARPGRTMARVNWRWEKQDGVHWQYRRGDEWLPQGRQGTFETFLAELSAWSGETGVAA